MPYSELRNSIGDLTVALHTALHRLFFYRALINLPSGIRSERAGGRLTRSCRLCRGFGAVANRVAISDVEAEIARSRSMWHAGVEPHDAGMNWRLWPDGIPPVRANLRENGDSRA